MSDLYSQLKSKLQTWAPTLLNENETRIEWQIPSEPEHGILTTNIAFILAKSLRQNPNQIAQSLKLELDHFINANQLQIESIQVGPYLNLKLKTEFYTKIVQENILVQNQQNSLQKEAKTVLLDYVGANVAKRLHAGHMRNLNLGESLRRILSLKYDKIITDNHWGDWGVQFGVLLWGWKQIIIQNKFNLEIPEISLESYDQDPVGTLQQIYVWANAQESSVENWKELVRAEFISLSDKDAQNTELWLDFVKASKADIKADLELFKVKLHDIEQGESFYEPDMSRLTDFMNQNQLWQIENQARFFDFENLVEDWIDLKDQSKKEIAKFGRAYLISSSGYTSYCYRDVAARWQWARDYQANLMISVVDKTQKHNFDQAFSIIQYLASLNSFADLNHDLRQNKTFSNGINTQADPNFAISIDTQKTLAILQDSDSLVHVGYGFLSLPEGKMSTRKGNVLLIKDLVNEVQTAAKANLSQKNPEINFENLETRSKIIAIAALKWFDLNRDSWADIVLDVPQILQFEGNTGVYQLYTYARLRSILKKIKAEKLKIKNEQNQSKTPSETLQFLELNQKLDNTQDLFNEAEKLMIQQIYTFPETLERAAQNYKPHFICNHLYTLCDKINSWYNSTSIMKELDPHRQTLLLELVSQITEHLSFVLDLLGIEVLEEI